MMIANNQLQGMFAGWQVEAGLGLAATKVHVVVVGRNGLACRRQGVGVDQQVVVAGGFALNPCWRHAHALKAKLHGDRGADGRAVAGGNEKHLGVFRCGGLGKGEAGAAGQQQAGESVGDPLHGVLLICVFGRVILLLRRPAKPALVQTPLAVCVCCLSCLPCGGGC